MKGHLKGVAYLNDDSDKLHSSIVVSEIKNLKSDVQLTSM